MEWYEPLALIALSLVAGAYGVIIGAGGGFILGPLFILIWDKEPAIAVATSLTAVTLTAISGSLGYRHAKTIDYRSGVLFALASVPGYVLGALALAKAPGGLVQLAFGSLLLAASAFLFARPMMRHPNTAAQTQTRRHASLASRTIVTAKGETLSYTFNEPAAVSWNLLFGVFASFFGIGGGLMRVPLLVYAFRFPIAVAVATSVFTMALASGAGVVTYAALGKIDGLILLYAGIGVILGAQAGVALAPRLRQSGLIRLMAMGMGVTGLWLVLRGAEVL
ncbi:MAG: sulfite exporter TauE/SafE family protein [Dehalococcoidia bacterium]|nr:sulfite exporter TauE/SafE family protein [Dehalococcoidia bacterium]